MNILTKYLKLGQRHLFQLVGVILVQKVFHLKRKREEEKTEFVFRYLSMTWTCTYRQMQMQMDPMSHLVALKLRAYRI